MRIIEPGHVYDLNWLDGEPPPNDNDKGGYPAVLRANRLIFVNREAGTEHPGTQTQEVLRALIDRTRHCDACLRWPGNDQIIYHLRMALVLHEARALERKTEKGLIAPEHVTTGPDGHFDIEERTPEESLPFVREASAAALRLEESYRRRREGERTDGH